MDGLNWDLLNDGMGNPKNTRTMFLSHRTSPVMTLGVRASAEVAVTAGFVHIQFLEPSGELAECVNAYLKNMKEVPSPFLVAHTPSKQQTGGGVRPVPCSRRGKGGFVRICPEGQGSV